jgi:hypothetical protein
MNLANILKIAGPTLKLGEVAAIAANNGYQSQTSKALGGLSQVTNLASSVVPGSSTANAANTTTPSPKPVAPPKPTPGPTVPKSKIQAQHAAERITNVPKPQAELLKVNPEVKPGGYTKESGLQESYLKGLGQSGAKLDNKGQIVKQSGQAFKTEGWDRKAQLMGGRRTPDRLHRLRMLAIDKAANAEGTKAATTEIGSNIPKTKDEAEVKNWYDSGLGTNSGKPKSKPKSKSTAKPSGLTDKEMRKKYYKHENGNWYEKGYDPGVTPLW